MVQSSLRRVFPFAFALGFFSQLAMGGCVEPEGADCDVGQLDCECLADAACTDGSVCELGLCVGAEDEAGESESSESGSEDGSSDGGSDDETSSAEETGEGLCQESTDCFENEVCVEGVCGDTDLYYFDASIIVFEPPVCRDGVGTAELRYYAYQDGVETDISSEAGCPGAWPNEPFVYDSLSTLELDFYEVDAFFDDFIVTMCWLDEAETCDVVPKVILHDGGWVGTVGGSYIELRFEPTPF